MWKIEKRLIFGLMFDTTSVNTGIHRKVTVNQRLYLKKLLAFSCN